MSSFISSTSDGITTYFAFPPILKVEWFLSDSFLRILSSDFTILKISLYNVFSPYLPKNAAPTIPASLPSFAMLILAISTRPEP